jgi:hypothetical protein
MEDRQALDPTGRVARIAAFMRRGYDLDAACVVTAPLDADRRDAEGTRIKVSYLHYSGTFGHPYRVSRAFDTPAEADEFISVNAMVAPLPGLRVEAVR